MVQIIHESYNLYWYSNHIFEIIALDCGIPLNNGRVSGTFVDIKRKTDYEQEVNIQ